MYSDLKGGKHVVVVVVGDDSRFWIITAYIARALAAGEVEWARKLSFKYDRNADILHIDKCQPYGEQGSEELGDARLNPETGEIENLEVLFFSTRLLRGELFEVPISADLRIAAE